MFKKIALYSLFVSLPLLATTDIEVIDTKNKIDALAQEIKYQEKNYEVIDNKLNLLSIAISKKQDELENTKKNITRLKNEYEQIKKDIKKIEEQIVDEMINTYSASLGLELAKKATKDEIVDKEIYTLLLKSSKQNVVELNEESKELKKIQKLNDVKKVQYEEFIKNEEKKKAQYLKTKEKKTAIINEISQYHEKYKQELENIQSEQKSQENLLFELDVLNNQEDNSIITTGTYIGSKTMAPLQAYKVEKKFGRYFDPIFKKELFNDSITLSTPIENSKVFNITNGKVHQIKKDTEKYKSLIVIKHSNDLFTIFYNLNEINEDLKIDQRIRKGTELGTINKELIFQVIQNNSYIDPQELLE